MQTNIYQLYHRKLNGLTVFRRLLDNLLIKRLQLLLRACEESDTESLTDAYAAFASVLFEQNVNLTQALLELVLDDENRFLLSAAREEACPTQISAAAHRELDFFTELSTLSAKAIKTSLPEEIAAFLPDWKQPLWIFMRPICSTLPTLQKKAMASSQNIMPFPSKTKAYSP